MLYLPDIWSQVILPIKRGRKLFGNKMRYFLYEKFTSLDISALKNMFHTTTTPNTTTLHNKCGMSDFSIYKL